MSFHHYLNGVNSNIKLSIEYSQERIQFLDLELSKTADGDLHTSIYRKETHKNTLLHANSFHPSGLKNNIPYGQFQRLRRICDVDDDYNVKSVDMGKRFEERGYSRNVIDLANNKASELDREKLLERKPKKTKTDRVFFSTQYSNRARSICNIIKKKLEFV